MSEYGGQYDAYTAAGGGFGPDSAQYSQYLADQRAAQDLAYEQSPEGQRMQEYHQQRALARKSDKGTFNIIAGVFAAVAVVLTAGTALGAFAAAGGLEGAVAAGVAEGAIEGGAAAAAVAEAAPAVAAVEAGGVAAGGGAAGAAEAAAPSLFSSIIDGATSVYNAVSGAIETVGNLTNISGPLGEAIATETGLNPAVANLGAKTVVGAGRGALTSAIQGQDPGLGALGGAVSGLVGGGTRALLGPSGLGLGTTGFEGGITGTVAGAAGGAASGAARAAASGGDAGAAALRGAATGGGGALTSYLLGEQGFNLGNTASQFGGSLASSLIGQAMTPTPSVSSGTSRNRATSAALGSLGGALGGGITNGGITGGGAPSGTDAASGAATTGAPSTISASALASLLSTGSDPGYSSPISGDSSLDSNARPSPWNTASLRTTDPTGSSYG
jgi:hypothetical protein